MNVPIPMPRLTRIPMTVRFVMTGLTLAVKELSVTWPRGQYFVMRRNVDRIYRIFYKISALTSALPPLSRLTFSALELGGLGGSEAVAETQASTNPTKLIRETQMLNQSHPSARER